MIFSTVATESVYFIQTLSTVQARPAQAFVDIYNIHNSVRLFYRAFQVCYYSEALPTQNGYCVGVSRRSTKATANEGIALGPYMAAIAGFEPTTFWTKGDEFTIEQPRPANIGVV